MTTTAYQHLRNTVLRGGRMTKCKGMTASIAPMVGAVIMPTLLAGAMTLNVPQAAQAGTCVPTAPGVWNCSGPATITDTTQNLSPAPGGAMTVTTNPNFAITTTDVTAINLTNSVGDGSITFLGAGSVITGARYGIRAVNSGTSLDLTSFNVKGETLGIYARNSGSGALTITSTGTASASGSYGSGIRAINDSRVFTFDPNSTLVSFDYGEATDLTVTSVNATGGFEGIKATNVGKGALTVISTGIATATNSLYGYGIYASNYRNGTDLSITSTGATGSTNGILARNYGAGATTITASGTTTGTNGHGIFAQSLTYGSSVSITTDGTISGGRSGLYARNLGIGATTIKTTGKVTGRTESAIYAKHLGKDDLRISLGGDLLGAMELTEQPPDLCGDYSCFSVPTDGITAYNRVGSFNASIIVEQVANDASIIIEQSANTTITGYRDGINAHSYAGKDLVISASNVTGGRNGISARNYGDGLVNITATGTVTGTAGNGIHALNTGTDLTIAAVDVSGFNIGVYARNSGSGTTSITTTGKVTGGGGAAIDTLTSLGALTTINLAETSMVLAGASGIAIRNNDGNSDTTSKGIVTGDAVLGTGNDIFNLAAGTFDGDIYGDGVASTALDGDDTFNWTGGTMTGSVRLGGGSDRMNVFVTASVPFGMILDGGDDDSALDGMIDVLTFDGWLGDINGRDLLNWEQIVLTGGAQMGLGPEVNGDGMLGLSLFVEDSTLFAEGDFTIAGKLINNGLVTTVDDTVGDVVTVSRDYSGSGILAFDTNLETATSDNLVIYGNVLDETSLIEPTRSARLVTSADVSTGTRIEVNVLGGTAMGESVRLITVVGENNGAYSLVGGPIESGVWTYDLAVAQNVDLISQINAIGAVYESAPSVLLSGFASLPTLERRVGQRQWLVGGEASVDGVWMRVHGESANVTPSESVSAASWSSSTWGLQLGADVLASASENGHWVLGVTGQYGNIRADVSNGLGHGTISGSGYGLGATATWYGHGGTYVDLQGQANWISANYTTAANGALASDRRAIAYAVSAEFGHRYTLDDNRRHALVPQAQLTWSQVSGDSFTDSLGNDVAFGTDSRTIGRIGLAYEYRPKGLSEGQRANDKQMVYGIVNFLHDFSSAGSVDVTGTTLQSRGEGTWGEIGIGGSMAIAPDIMLYGQASYRQAVSGSGSDNNGRNGTVGLRFQW